MDKLDIQNLILNTEVRSDVRLTLVDKSLENKFKDHIRRASRYGYKIVFTKLYDDVYYFEKLKEGDREIFSAKFRSNGKTRV